MHPARAQDIILKRYIVKEPAPIIQQDIPIKIRDGTICLVIISQ